ncbi:MAG: bacteriohopanetetrol glucosamine biosynthesis glycosyltransferase HpnI [Acidobacteriota bacterium]
MALLRIILLLPILGGAVFSLLSLWAVLRFRRRAPYTSTGDLPRVSILKPVHGIEKNLRQNLRSACLQEYPVFEVIFSVQRHNDPALPLLRNIAREFGPQRVKVVVDEKRPGSNGKINNMAGALPHARFEVLVISDSDVRLPPDYLASIVAPLSDPGVGFVCTPYRATSAERWFEKLELLSLNADFMPSVVFASETGASLFCLGASIAIRKATIAKVGGLESLADYLVEDYEMGRRVVAAGQRGVLVAPIVETMVDLQTPGQWWKHQVYWDQNTRAARPMAFFCTVLIRAVPFAVLSALLDPWEPVGWLTLAVTLAVRMGAAGIVMRSGFGDEEGLRALPLLPVRDLAGLASWMLAFLRRTTNWRGTEFILTRDGRLVSH